MNYHIQKHQYYSRELVRQFVSVINRTWPGDKSEEEMTDGFLANKKPNQQSFSISKDHEMVGYAELFSRTVLTAKGPLEVGCLAGVCILESERGNGLGKQLVEAVFRELDNCPFDVILFQTGVPSFYEPLGAKSISNQFINSQADNQTPWWDEHVMIYPQEYPWPEGTVDTQGSGW